VHLVGFIVRIGFSFWTDRQINKLSCNRSSERPVKADCESTGSDILEKDGRSYDE